MGVKWKTPNARPSIFYLLMNKNLVAGLDIGTAAIRLVVCEQLSESRTLRILAQAKKESRGLKRGYIINFEETLENLRETVREAERQAKLPIKNVPQLGRNTQGVIMMRFTNKTDKAVSAALLTK